MLNNLKKTAVCAVVTLFTLDCAEISLPRAPLAVNNNQDFSHLINALPMPRASAPDEIELDIYDEQPGAQVEGLPQVVAVNANQMGQLSPDAGESHGLLELEQLREPRGGESMDQKLLAESVASDDIDAVFPVTGQIEGTIAILPETNSVASDSELPLPVPSAPARALIMPELNPEILKVYIDSCSYDWHLGKEIASLNKRFLDAAASGKDLSQFKNSINNVDVQDNDGMTALMYAVKANCFKQLCDLLEMNVNLNSPIKNNDGLTALNLACAYGNLNVIELLIHKGIKLEHNDLKFAVAKNSVDVVKELYNRLFGYEILSDLIQCAFVHDSECAKFLWEQQLVADPNLKVKEENAKVLMDVKYGSLPEGTTALHWAVRNNELQLVKWLISQKADINAVDGEGNTPLLRLVHTATLEKNNAMLQKLNIYKQFDTTSKCKDSHYYTGFKYCLNETIYLELIHLNDKLDVSIINNGAQKAASYLMMIHGDLKGYLIKDRFYHRIQDLQRRDKTAANNDCCVIL